MTDNEPLKIPWVLWVSEWVHFPELITTRSLCTSLSIASESFDEFTSSELIDSLRQFVDLIDFSEDSDHGWDLLLRFANQFFTLSLQCSFKDEKVLLWLLGMLASDIQERSFWGQKALMLRIVLYEHQSLRALDCFLRLGPANAIDIAGIPGGYTMLHYVIKDFELPFKPLLARDPYLHTLGYDPRYSPKPETPTSLAMYNFRTFSRWSRGFLDSGKQIDNLIDQETQEGPVFDVGWKPLTLRLLFNSDILDAFCHLSSEKVGSCADCPVLLYFGHVAVQPYWLIMLSAIRTGTDPNHGLQVEKERRYRRSAATQRSVSIDTEEITRDPEDSKDQEAISIVGAESTIGSDEDECPYEVDDMLCMDCWCYFERTGQLYEESDSEASSEEDQYSQSYDDAFEGTGQCVEELDSEASSEEDECSPFHIHA